MESLERARAKPSEKAGPAGWPYVVGATSAAPSERSARDAGMELTDVSRRIFGLHRRLILLCVLFVLVGIGIAALVRGGSQTYTASARLVLDTEDPKTRAESTSIADTGKALATSPAQVRAALNDAHLTNRDAVDIAKNHVSIRPLGTSAVLQLSVSDKNRRAAADLANALANRVIRARLSVSSGQLQQVLTDLDERIDTLNIKIANADAQLDSLNVRLATAGTAASANALRAQRDSVTRSRDFLAQQRGVLESERVSLLSTDALRPKPSIISPATVPDQADPSHWLTYVLLGTILGLILGIGWAGLLEMFRPTIVGHEAIAREMETSLLGALPDEPDENTSAALPAISARLWFAAEAVGVTRVGLLPLVPDLDLRGFAERLNASEPGAGGPRPGSEHASSLAVRPVTLRDASMDVRGGLGLVLVAPAKMKKASLVEMNELVRLTGVPVLGLITYPPRTQKAGAQRRDLEAAAPAQAPSAQA